MYTRQWQLGLAFLLLSLLLIGLIVLFIMFTPGLILTSAELTATAAVP